MDFDRSRNLEELENDYWGEPQHDSHLVETVHALRRKPLSEFTTEDLETMIGQRLSLEYTLPIALEMLDNDPCLHVWAFPCDLLLAVANVASDFWSTHPELLKAFLPILERGRAQLELMEWYYRDGIDEALTGALNRCRLLLEQEDRGI